MSDWFTRGGDGGDLVVQSLLVLTMTFLMLRTGLDNPVGIVALILQVGLLIRINYEHGSLDRGAEKKAEA